MRLAHLSDLHLGKRVNEFSMLEDQRAVLQRVSERLQQEDIDAVLLAGDIYDRPVPPAEAVMLFDTFLTDLEHSGKPVMMISGNHDSAERLAFGTHLFERLQVHIAPPFSGEITHVDLIDQYGPVHVYLLPFLRPSLVNRFLQEGEEPVSDYTQAVDRVLKQISFSPDERNILVAHQFVTGGERSASEEVQVGGLDQVDASVFDRFDYVALGHLHGPQQIGRPEVRYSGSPLKYSFSETRQHKSLTLIDLGAKGEPVKITTEELIPVHDLREIRGDYEELMNRSFYQGTAVTDYLHITLTDEEDVPDALGRLRTVYPNIMRLDYDNSRTRSCQDLEHDEAGQKQSPEEVFADFYKLRNNRPMSEEQTAYIRRLTESVWKGRE